MYLEIDEDLYKKITDVTSTDYEAKGNFITADNIISMLEDLLSEIDRKQEELDDFKKDVEDNYKPISYAEQVGYNERDFYE